MIRQKDEFIAGVVAGIAATVFIGCILSLIFGIYLC